MSNTLVIVKVIGKSSEVVYSGDDITVFNWNPESEELYTWGKLIVKITSINEEDGTANVVSVDSTDGSQVGTRHRNVPVIELEHYGFDEGGDFEIEDELEDDEEF